MAVRSTARALPVTEGAVVTKAVLRAGEQLGLTNRVLAAVLGVSDATVSRMTTGAYQLRTGEKPYELAVLFLRLFRSLDAIVGGDQAAARGWMQGEHMVLGGRPAVLVQTVAGLVNVLGYLDARRAVI